MRLPAMKQLSQPTQRQNIAFGGINYTDNPKDGELLDSRGLTSARYPVLSQRGGRAEDDTYTAPTAIFAWGKLCVVDGTDFYYDGVNIGPVLSGQKQFAVINTKFCFWPDKKYLDVSNPASPKLVNLDAQVQALANTAVFETNTVTLNANPSTGETVTRTGRSWYSNEEACILQTNGIVVKASAATVGMQVRVSYNAGYYIPVVWCGTGGELPSASAFDPANANGIYSRIKAKSSWSDEGAEMEVTEVVYTLYDANQTNADLTASFAIGDMVTISGCSSIPANNKSAIIRSVSAYVLTFDAATFTAGSEAAAILIKRSVPDLEFICEWDNRLWGVQDKTIYASALGDPRNFEVFENLSTDSYTVAVGTDGDFTGCVAYSDCVLFWKDNCLHKIVGTQPSDFYMYIYNITGLQAGSHKSLEIINEVLYYKGRNGIYAYTGGTPQLISEDFGTRRYTNANAGADGFQYLVSMMDDAGAWHMFSYDTQHRLWLHVDNTHALDFTCLDGVLHFIAGTKVYQAEQADSTEIVQWLAEFAPIYETVHNKKQYLRLYLRLELSTGASVRAEVKADDGAWVEEWACTDATKRTEIIPLTMNRCDKLSIRLSGTGGCVIRSMVREYQVGSEV